METEARYVIGIDLGTTNTAVSYVDLAADAETSALQHFEIPQLVGPGEFGHQPVLPSFLYVPGPHELPEGSTALPWDENRPYAVGAFARDQGARVPGRLVASAKSWLCHANVDRTADILPWDAPEDIEQVSPVEAATRYLQHLREAWNHLKAEGEAERFEEQLLILTVPASFDEVARELTVEAAERAGLPQVILLEEPLAAFYAWLDTHELWRNQLADGQLILVCDVGGGTTDFSIIGVHEDDEGFQFERMAVGDHLMLGGDNMDHALARRVEADLAGETGRLETRRWHQLVHQCRRAKEELLSGSDAPEEIEITVAGTGSALIADTLTSALDQSEVEAIVLDGFFPMVDRDAPLAQQRSGLTELGLPYEQDPAITRQLAAFWRRTEPYLRAQTERDNPYPDHILFNGGVFNAESLRERIKAVVQQWFAPEAGSAWHPTELTNDGLDRAVAAGAAYYGLVRLGKGIRVGSGSPRSYYVGLETAEGDTDGIPAICLVPRGAPEGYEGRLADRTFEALANQPVTFHLFSSSTRSGDALGEVVRLREDEISTLPPIRTVLEFGKRYARTIPVQLAVQLTEVGTLQLWCESVHTEHRWRLQFDVREKPEQTEDGSAEAAEVTIDPSQIEEACDAIEATFEGRQHGNQPDQIWEGLASIVDQPRAKWPLPLLRKCADTLLDVPRDETLHHEVCWYDLLGYCLRPGYGDPVDDWRMQQAWILQIEGLEYARREENRMAWWLFWRRVAGGLPGNKQEQFYYEARPFIQLDVRTRKDHPVYTRRMKLSEKSEAWQTLATFERVKPDIKVELAELLFDTFEQSGPRGEELWALSRLGTRHPVYGPLDKVVPHEEVAAWIDRLLGLDLEPTKDAAYALAHLARRADDRDRSVPDDIRKRVARWLDEMPNAERYRALLETANPAPDHLGQDWFIVEPLPREASTVIDPQGITYATTDNAVANS